MKRDYAEFECIVGIPAASKPKEDKGWRTMPSESPAIVLAPGGTVSAKVVVERAASQASAAELFGSTFDKGVTLTFVPPTVAVPAWVGCRVLVEVQVTTAANVTTNGPINVWAEDA